MSENIETQNELTDEEMNALLSMNIEHEFNEISRSLDRYHAIFYQIWDMGYPRLTFDVPTAAVTFDKRGKRLEFLFNPLFWKQSDTYTKQFVICHECLHVILNHGARIRDLKKTKLNGTVANLALDVVINHMLIDKFNFDRASIGNSEDLCWIDTVFGKDHAKIERNRAFEYYFGILKQKITQNASKMLQYSNDDGSQSDVTGECVDMHDLLESIDDENVKKKLKEHIEKNLNDVDKKDLVDKIMKTGEGKSAQNDTNPGNATGGMLLDINIKQQIEKKKKWETVIKKWSLRYNQTDQDVEQWARINRRIDGLMPELMLPSDYDDDKIKNERIDVWFFCDTSGSCLHFKDRFFNAARSLPTDRFQLRLFSFDTQVYDADINNARLWGGGGTRFDIMESRIQYEMKSKNIKYPSAVFVITDGFGTNLRVQFPKRWYWFLSTNYKSCIPKESNIYMLSQFE